MAAARSKPAASRPVACPPPPAQISKTVGVISLRTQPYEPESNRVTKRFPSEARIPKPSSRFAARLLALLSFYAFAFDSPSYFWGGFAALAIHEVLIYPQHGAKGCCS